MSTVQPTPTQSPPAVQVIPSGTGTAIDYHKVAMIAVVLISSLINVAVVRGWISPEAGATAKQLMNEIGPALAANSKETQQVVVDETRKAVAATNITVTDKADETQKKVEAVKDAVQPIANVIAPGATVAPATMDDILALLKKFIDAERNQKPAVTPPIDPPKPVVVVPAPVPVTPVAMIVASDSKGKPLAVDVSKMFSMVDEGRQFTLTSTGTVHAGKSTSLVWALRPSNADDVDATQFPDGSGYAVTMRNGAGLTVAMSVAQGDSAAAAILMVKCNQAAQPPPGPVVVVPPSVIPPVVNPPVPVGSKKFEVVVVEDNSVQRSLTTGSILNNLTLHRQLTDKGHSFSSTTVNKGDAASLFVKSAGVALPAIAIKDLSTGQFVKAVSLPTDLGLSVMASLGG